MGFLYQFCSWKLITFSELFHWFPVFELGVPPGPVLSSFCSVFVLGFSSSMFSVFVEFFISFQFFGSFFTFFIFFWIVPLVSRVLDQSIIGCPAKLITFLVLGFFPFVFQFFIFFHRFSMGFQRFPDFDLGVSLLPRGFSREGYAYAPVAFRGGETETSPGEAPRGPELGQCQRNLHCLHGRLRLGLNITYAIVEFPLYLCFIVFLHPGNKIFMWCWSTEMWSIQ